MVLFTIVNQPNQRDGNILLRLLKYLVGTHEFCLKLNTGKTSFIKWHVDAEFVVHSDFKLHTEATLTVGKGAIVYLTQKQKLNMKSSTEAELVGVDDVSSLILRTNIFWKHKDIRPNKKIKIIKVLSYCRETVKIGSS